MVLHYYQLYLYNDTQLGFERIMNAFNGYTELKKRLYSFTGPYTSWTWDVESDKTGESVVGQYATITPNQYAGYPSVNITISHSGDYDIVCTFSNAYRTEEWRYQVFVDPDEE